MVVLMRRRGTMIYSHLRALFSTASSTTTTTGSRSTSTSRLGPSSTPYTSGFTGLQQRERRFGLRYPAIGFGLEKLRHFSIAASSDAGGDSDPSGELISNSSREWAGAAWESVKEMSSQAANYTKHTVMPNLQQWLDPSSPYTMQGLVPTTVALATCAAAWMILPRALRRLHNYVEQGPTARLLGHTTNKLAYEMSVWAALEDPTRLFLTLVAFSQLAALVAPSTVAAHYVEQVWRGGLVLSVLWFLHRWKTVAFSRMLIGKASTKEEQERYMALDKVSSIGIIVLGAMALAEASGVAVQSILTVGGIGGIATAFAARDILGNALSGIIMQFLKPFSVGDVITAGNIEGQVIEMGLHSTSILNLDKYPMVVPNSFFSSQVIVNKSRTKKQSLKSRMYVRFSDIDKLPAITTEVGRLLRDHPKIMSEQDSPLCYLSRTAPTHLEITLGYDVPPMSKHETLALEQEVLVKAAEVIKKSGATLGAPA